MKKGIVALIVCAALCTVAVVLPVNVEAAGVSVGASTWYAQWKMPQGTGIDLKSEWSLMYGPVVGMDFAKYWSVTSVLLTGNFIFDNPSPVPDINYRRYDSDTTLNYSIFRWLKVFGGFKYMRYDLRTSFDEVPPFGSADFRHYTYGPGLGIGLTVPLYESLYALGNISVMYLSGNNSIPEEDSRYIEKGYNAALSLAYYIESISTTISAGARYQYFNSEECNAEGNGDPLKFYGVTFSAVYNFSLDPTE